MSHQQIPSVQQQSKTSANKPISSAPIPLDPKLLHHVGGGTEASTPIKGW
jgi:hypothetical protein